MHKQRCYTCRQEFKDGDLIVPIVAYVTNERRGDFASSQPTEFVHASHLKSIKQAVRMDDKQPCVFAVVHSMNHEAPPDLCGRPTRMQVDGKRLCQEHLS